jgi:predicted PurR-regulated permease PerM
VDELEAFLGRFMDTSALDLEAAVTGAVKKFGAALLGQVTPFLQNIVWTIAQLLLALIVMVVLFHDGQGYLAAARKYLPLADADRDAVFQRLHDVTGAVFYGVMLTAAIQGALGGIGWAVAGLPSAITAGIAMFFCALLPAGTVIIWAPAVFWLFVSGRPVAGALLLAWCALVVSTIDNVLKPFFIGGRTQLNTLMVFFGIVGGMIAFGFSGLFIGPLVITLFLSLIEVIRRDFFGTPPPGPTAVSSPP